MRVLNVHERYLPAGSDEVGGLLAGLGSEVDQLWPSDSWPAMRVRPHLEMGAAARHGPVHYRVEDYEPGNRIVFRFQRPLGFDGTHAFLVRRSAEGGASLRHVVDMRTRGVARLTWPLFYRPMHDAVIEELLDNAERACAGQVTSPARRSWYVRLLRSLASFRSRRA